MNGQGGDGRLSPAHRLAALEYWFSTPLGREILELEQAMLDRLLPRLFGYRMLQLGVSERLPLYRSSCAGHRFMVLPARTAAGGEESVLVSAADGLALHSESVDIVLLHHGLEFSANPHQVLREAARVTIAGGSLVVVGFNPWSLLGLGRGGPLWSGHFLSAGRLRDWAALLDFRVDAVRYGFYRVPVNNRALLRTFRWLEGLGEAYHLPFGGVYLMLARKQPLGMTPIAAEWKARPLVLPGMPRYGELRRVRKG